MVVYKIDRRGVQKSFSKKLPEINMKGGGGGGGLAKAFTSTDLYKALH